MWQIAGDLLWAMIETFLFAVRLVHLDLSFTESHAVGVYKKVLRRGDADVTGFYLISLCAACKGGRTNAPRV
jgi:hypothetical protein